MSQTRIIPKKKACKYLICKPFPTLRSHTQKSFGHFIRVFSNNSKKTKRFFYLFLKLLFGLPSKRLGRINNHSDSKNIIMVQVLFMGQVDHVTCQRLNKRFFSNLDIARSYGVSF